MRLALVVPEYPPDTIGGGGVVAEALALRYSARHEVRVFSAWDARRSWTETARVEHRDGVVVHRYPLMPLAAGADNLRSVLPPAPRALAALATDLAAFRPTVAHLHGFGCAVVDAAGLILRARRMPFVVTVHGLPRTWRRHGAAVRAAYRAYASAVAGHTLRQARAVTAVSSVVASQLEPSLAPIVVPNGVTPLPTARPGRVAALRAELGVPLEVPLVVAVGRLEEVKGFDVLLQALVLLQRPVACALAGADGLAAPDLRSCAKALPADVQVCFLGALSRPRLGELIAAADVFAVPSRYESFCLVALEALAADRRVVATTTGGMVDFLNAEIAELCPPDDPAALARGLSAALSRGGLTQEERRQAGLVVAAHDWEVVAEAYERVLADVSERGPGFP